MTTNDEQVAGTNLSCTFCGPGTWAIWEIVSDEGLLFVCDWHHVEISKANIIQLERLRGKEAWNKVPEK